MSSNTLELKPNLIVFQSCSIHGEIGDNISLNCSEIELIQKATLSNISKSEVTKGKISEIILKDGREIHVVGTVMELHHEILKN